MVNLSEIKLQKNRFKKKTKIKDFKFSNQGLIILKGFRLELVHIFFLKRIFKNLLKKKKNNLLKATKKIWFYLCPNFIVQKKSKNSRMGKGKGSFERQTIKVIPNQIIVEFSGLNIIKFKRFISVVNKKLNTKLFIIQKTNKKKLLWTKTNKYFLFFKKYLQ